MSCPSRRVHQHRSSRLIGVIAVVSSIVASLLLFENEAEACGCLSPPVPVDTGTYAVNQQAEQIIFEVEETHVVAHVLIQYAGDPESFAWLVPVPAVPELSLSSSGAFGLLDQVTAPSLRVVVRDTCPQPEYRCNYHGAPDDCIWPPVVDSGLPSADAGVNPSPGAVEIIDRQTIGAYDTVVLAAGDAQAAVDWLQNEGFIVNSSMAPYMQPYADEGMYFVASKLVPGADLTEIRPLRMRYLGTEPVIPLRLTAVAAEPHLTVTAYIYGQDFYQPSGRPLVQLDESALSRDPDGRLNYPMLMARAVDQAGGDGFVREYTGDPALPDFDQGTGCCNSEWDQCGIAFDGVCSCPGDANDDADCADQTELLEGLALLEELAVRHPRLTRLSTRISAEEMTFDPAFTAAPGTTASGRLTLSGETRRLSSCQDDIIETERYERILARQACASLYCGAGECVTTDQGPACACPNGTVARTFTDLDGGESVTCVPDQPPVDYGADGQVLPDACANVDCGLGSCIDVGGFPTCRCNAGAAATLGATEGAVVAACRAIDQTTGTPGAEDYSDEVAEVRVCAPTPPASCGEHGWLVENQVTGIRGEACASSAPDPILLVPPEMPTCEDFGAQSPPRASGGCGCQTPAGRGAPTTLVLVMAGLFLVCRRRRRA